MFGIADQHDERKTNQSGANPGIFGGQRVSRLSGQTPNRPVNLDRRGTSGAGIQDAWKGGQRTRAGLHRKDDGAEPGADNATHHPASTCELYSGLLNPTLVLFLPSSVN